LSRKDNLEIDTIMQDISCKTKNLVYAIICSNCGEFYVGETKTELQTRMTVHRQQTRHQDLTIIRAKLRILYMQEY
jgi:ribosomal protein L31